MSSQLKLSGYGAFATVLTSLSLLTVFQTSAWIVPVWGAVIIVAGLCALVRMSPLPAAFEPISAAVGVLLWVTGLYAHDVAFAGFIPNRAALRELGNVARSGFTEIHQLPTPAPAHHGLVMLTVVGVAAIALIVDLMTVTLRRAALAGLPLLALFTVCAATGHHGVGIVAFIGSAVGYLWLLYADNRDKVARWGAAVGSSRARPASAWSTDPASAPPPASLGRQVGAAAISLGLVVPLFIPGLHTGIGQHGGTGVGGHGGGSVQTFDPIVRIGADLAASKATPVLTYTTTSSHPGYIRLTSLDQFDGSSFTQGNLTATANQATSERLPVTAPPGTTVQTNFDISKDFVDVHWLPVETTALGVSLGEPWRFDPGTSTLFSAATTSTGLQYTERSVPNEPTPAQLAAAPKPDTNAGLQADMTLPTITPPVRVLEHQITKGATSRYQAALDIQQYLTSSRFHYDTSIPPDRSDQALYNFLFNTRRGFCQQFATAMAVMARLYGIPSRVAVGFTAGKPIGDGKYEVTTKDAHAWPELWFQGYGWLPFEPTPRGDGQAVTPSYAQPLGTTSQKGNKNRGSDTIGPRGIHKGAGATKPKGGAGSTAGIPASHHSVRSRAAHATVLALWVLLGLLVVVLIAPRTYRALVRRRRWRQANDPVRAPAAAWAEMRDTAVDRNAPWDDARSPRQIATTLLYTIEATPKTSDSMLRLARYEEESRYAAAANSQRANLRYDVEIVRDALDAERSRLKRWRTAILPRSVVLRTRHAMAVGSDRVHAIAQRLSPRAVIASRRRLEAG